MNLARPFKAGSEADLIQRRVATHEQKIWFRFSRRYATDHIPCLLPGVETPG
jgi:hypothetical protein